MLIGALCDYYDVLSETERITPDGWTSQDVNRVILLNPDGSIDDILPYVNTVYQKDGKPKEISKRILLPYRGDPTSEFAYRLDHRPEYIFGLEWDTNKSCVRTIKMNSKSKSPIHMKFVERNLKFIDGLASPTIDAFRNFLLRWKPEEHINDPVIVKLKNNLSKAYFCFALTGLAGNILGKDEPQIYERVMQTLDCIETEEDIIDTTTGMCAISGAENADIPNKHRKIKGLEGGISTGTLLVSFKKKTTSFQSYNKLESFNSSISVEMANKYVAALNYLLEEDNDHCSLFGNMTVVYWAMSRKAEDDTEACSHFKMFAEGDADGTNTALRNDMKRARVGKASDMLRNLNIDPDVDFYIVGLVPYKARISVKFCCKSTVAEILDNLKQHQDDLALDGNTAQPGINKLLSALYPHRKKGEESPKDKKPQKSKEPESDDDEKGKKDKGTQNNPLYSALFESIINGTKYPDGLLWEAVRRCKTDSISANHGVYAVRVSIIKACLNRASRLSNKKEEITMSLSTENTSPAYVCGRIFAILEYAQKEAAGTKLNRTIKDAYFASAATRPSAVLPRLVMLAQHHIEKTENVWLNIKLQDAVALLDAAFPKTLSISQQGEFIIGYYQQNKDLYSSNNKKASAE